MARTWSYRKREIVLNEVKPKGVPPAAVAYLLLTIFITGMVLTTAVYFTMHQEKEVVIVGPKSDSYKTAPEVGSGITDSVH